MSWDTITEQLLAPHYLGWLWDGFLVTLAISFLTIFFATVFGFILAMLRESPLTIIRYSVVGYNAIFRYSPLLPQLFFWYFGVGQILPLEFKQWLFDEPQISLAFITLKMPSFEFLIGLLGLIFYSSAFIAEEFRAGIQGVAKGQTGAGLALGFSRTQSLRYIILPQALKIAYPPLIGQYMNVIKNSSLTMAIGVLEISYVSRQVETETAKTFQDFAVATLLYILAIIVISLLGQGFAKYKWSKQAY